MITLDYLNDYENKITNYDYEIKKLEKKIYIEHGRVTSDTVQGSSKRFPFTKRNFGISGFNSRKIEQLKKRQKIFENKKIKLEKELRYKLNNLEDRQVADIIEKKYIEKMEWKQIAMYIGYAGESGARNRFYRYFEK